MGHGTWDMGHGTMVVVATVSLLRGYMGHGTWVMGHGTWEMVMGHGTWDVELGTWGMGNET